MRRYLLAMQICGRLSHASSWPVPGTVGDPVAMGMAEPLGRILIQLSGGGGATKVNIDAGKRVVVSCP